MEKVLVIGGAGFIGSNTVKRLLDEGYEVRVMDNLQERVHPNGYISQLDERAEFMKGDVTNKDDLKKALSGIDIVYNFAAYQDHLTDFSSFYMVNSVGVALLYEVIVVEKLPIKKIVFSSTQGVYGAGKFKCPEHGIFYGERKRETLDKGDWDIYCPVCHKKMDYIPLSEKDAEPNTPYGISKFAGETTALRLGFKYEIPTACLRYSLVQGWGQSIYNTYSGIGRIFNQRFMQGQPVIVYEDGQLVRDFIHVEDVVDANLLVMQSDKANYNVYNVGGEKPTTVYEYASKLAKLYGNKYPVEIPGIYRWGDPRHTYSSSDKLISIGWKRKHTIDDIVKDTFEWFNQVDYKPTFNNSEEVMFKSGVLRRI